MQEVIEKLWNEYLAEECAAVDTEEERSLAKKALNLHQKANVLLTKEQREAVEKYMDVLCELQSSFIKKAFFEGCRFAIAFLLETRMLGTK